LSAILALKNSTASSGRLTPAQKKGLTELWDDYAIEAQGVLDFAKIFGNTHDVVLEIGFGNGDTLVEMGLICALLIKRPIPAS
jgi:tRNA (guanine-N7-)-methyltransferase